MDKKPDSIGRATMDENETIIMDLRAVGPNGETGTGRIVYPKSHAQYSEILKHLGGLKPNENKPVPPFED